MIQYHFSCTLLSDVIISSSPATEGFHPSLEYIPGAKFWGIVAAQLYEKENQKMKLDLFHNGKVCFGDAHLVINKRRSHKVPLSWFKDKHKPDDGIYVHHAVADYNALTRHGVQPEQLSGEYFNEAGNCTKPAQDFSIKSAYDSDNRRSEDEKMYGYYALPAGSRWQFTVYSDSKDLLEKVKSALEGKRHIGRSRSAQYGLAQISFAEASQQEELKLSAGTHYFYADSAIILPLDMPLKETLPGASIDFEKSKIRTRLYQSWNTCRHTADADRMVIEKGSVIVVHLEKETTATALLQHLHERCAEGFGEVLLDPPFLNTRDGHFSVMTLSKCDGGKASEYNQYIQNGEKDQRLLDLLKKRQTARMQVWNIGRAVNQFVEKNKSAFRSVTASQWGTVRSYAKLFEKTEDLKKQLLGSSLIEGRKGYLVSGIAEEKWRIGKDLIEKILDESNNDYPTPRHLFLEKLAAEMAKGNLKKEN